MITGDEAIGRGMKFYRDLNVYEGARERFEQITVVRSGGLDNPYYNHVHFIKTQKYVVMFMFDS